jgi:hypothetical protein
MLLVGRALIGARTGGRSARQHNARRLRSAGSDSGFSPRAGARHTEKLTEDVPDE